MTNAQRLGKPRFRRVKVIKLKTEVTTSSISHSDRSQVMWRHH